MVIIYKIPSLLISIFKLFLSRPIFYPGPLDCQSSVLPIVPRPSTTQPSQNIGPLEKFKV